MKVISFSNARGGCGKTTCNLEVATVLTNKGYRVLVIDLDMQGSLTKACGAQLSDKNIFSVLTAKCSIKDAIQKTEFFDVIPAASELGNADRAFLDPEEDKFLISDVLTYVQDDYDFVFIDTSPARNILHKMVFISADYVIIPTRNDALSLDATVTQLNEIHKLKNSRSGSGSYNFKLIGFVLSEYDNTILSATAYDQLCEFANYEQSAFVCVISHAVKVAEIRSYHNAITKKYKSSKAGREFYFLAEKILAKIEEDCFNG